MNARIVLAPRQCTKKRRDQRTGHPFPIGPRGLDPHRATRSRPAHAEPQLSRPAPGIACRFIDAIRGQERFLVHQACFTGADEPYEKLKRALKAEIDEAAWASLYSTVSRPFDPAATGKIAITVINHYGDEVPKAYGT